MRSPFSPFPEVPGRKTAKQTPNGEKDAKAWPVTTSFSLTDMTHGFAGVPRGCKDSLNIIVSTNNG